VESTAAGEGDRGNLGLFFFFFFIIFFFFSAPLLRRDLQSHTQQEAFVSRRS
jgi:hypothetical protein